MRIALSAHVDEGTFAVFDGEAFDAPSTKAGASFLETFGKELPLVDRRSPTRRRRPSSRSATSPASRSRARRTSRSPAIVWARSLLVSEKALPVVEARAGKAAT